MPAAKIAATILLASVICTRLLVAAMSHGIAVHHCKPSADCNRSGSFATLAVIRRASPRVSSLAAEPARHDSSPPNRLSAAL